MWCFAFFGDATSKTLLFIGGGDTTLHFQNPVLWDRRDDCDETIIDFDHLSQVVSLSILLCIFYVFELQDVQCILQDFYP